MRRMLPLVLLVACQPVAPLAQPSPTAEPTPTPTASPAATPAGTGAQTATCGQRITQSFVLANDLKCDKDALVVAADGVVVDLGGRTITGPGMGPQTWPNPQLDSVAVRVQGRSGVTVKNGKMSDFSTGVYFESVAGGTIEAIVSERSRYGVYIHNSSKNTVRGITVSANIYGLHLQRSHDNVITDNRLVRQTYNSPGGYGIYLFASDRNEIVGNSIENNVNWGIWFSEAKGNRTYHNNVAGNRPQVSDNTEGNVWHDATRKQGNYWGDYPGRDTNGDGIGDSSYLILGPADVVDPYPFVERDGWKRRSMPTIDTYQPPVARPRKEARPIVLAGTSVYEARAGVGAVATGLSASSIALNTDGRTLYAIDGQQLTVYDVVASRTRSQFQTAVAGVVAANRDGRSVLVVSGRGAEQYDTVEQQREFFAYGRSPVSNAVAPSYKHNHIFVGHAGGVDLFYLNLGGRTPYTIPTGGPVGAMAMNGSGTRIYAAIPAMNDIAVIDTEQYAVVDRITAAGVNAIAVSPREDVLYVGRRDGIAAIALRDKREVASAAFLGVVMDLAVSPNGDELYAALAGIDQGLAIMRTADLTRADLVRFADLPTRVLVASY